MNDIERGRKEVQEAKCPDCAGLMANMGLDFESPKKEDLKKWEHIKSLYSVGIAFHSCGCSGPGYIPNSKEKLIEYFEDLKDKYFKNLNFWRSRTEPTNAIERDKEWNKNWAELSWIGKRKNGIITNQEGISYWLEKVKQIEHKISLIR